MKTLIVIQARTGSSRLPHKVMMPVAGAPMLQRMVERVQTVSSPVEIIVATTTDPSDDPIRTLCRKKGIKVFSGHPTDLIDRHVQAARQEGADLVVKIPSDCPLVDPAVIERVLRYRTKSLKHYDYYSNLHPATYPDGNDVEVMTMDALETAWREARRPFEREHTTPFLWEQPKRFAIGNITWESGADYSMSHRWTVDYPEDYLFVKTVYDELWTHIRPNFSLYEILALLEQRPDIREVNQRYAGVNWYRHHLSELRTVGPDQTKEPEPQ